jgi:hypothetical protein
MRLRELSNVSRLRTWNRLDQPVQKRVCGGASRSRRPSRRRNAADTCTPSYSGRRPAPSIPYRPRVPDALPEKLRGRAEKTLSGLAGGGAAGKDLRVLLDQAKRSFGEQAAAGRSRFEEQWRGAGKPGGDAGGALAGA